MTRIALPLRIGTYDDAGQVCDADGFELFTFGQNEDIHEMDARTALIAKWVMTKLNGGQTSYQTITLDPE